MIRLQHLRAKATRGIVDGPYLEFGTGGLLLCGDNGTGKSSFIDAIEKVLTGQCSSLDTGDQGLSWSRQGKHIQSRNAPEIEVGVTDGNNKVTPIRLDADRSGLNKEVQTFLNASEQQSFILRRKSMLKFIESTPRDRYEAVEGFLHFESFTKFEERLKGLLADVQTQLKVTQETKRQREQMLRTTLQLGAANLTESNYITQLNLKLETAGSDKIASVREIPSRIVDLEAELASLGNINSFQTLQGLLLKIKEVPSENGLIQGSGALVQARQKYQEEESKLKGHFHAEVLERGLAWIQEDSLDQCPLCDNAITLDAVRQHVARRLAENQQLTALKKSLNECEEALLASLKNHSSSLQAIAKGWKDAVGSEFPQEAYKTIVNLGLLIKQAPGSIADVVADKDGFAALHLDRVAAGLLSDVEAKLKATDTLPAQADRAKTLALLRAVESHLSEIASSSREAIRLDAVATNIKMISTLAEKARKSTVQELMDKTAQVADTYFKRIHPGEDIGNPVLKVTERGTASLELDSMFHGKTGDPRGFFSEGHVDSLGLCLFLAIRRLHHTQRPELALLILDDVLQSVDGDHRRATADLIFEEFKDHQIVITTHDPLWFENLKAAARKYFPGRKFTQHRIATWSLETGPVWGDHLADYEWLVAPEGKAAKPADRVSKAGRVLEEMLQNLCHNMQVPVPFNIKGEYTIDPLWNNFSIAARRHSEFISAAGADIDKLEQLRNLRNWVGAHWNEWASRLTATEASEFCGAVIGLRNLVYCPNCEDFVARVAQLKGVWSCSGEHLRYKHSTARPTR